MISLCDLFIPCIGGLKDFTKEENPFEIAVSLQKEYGVANIALSWC